MSLPPSLSWYRGLTRLAAPVLPLLLERRARAGKEHPERRRERLGHASQPRPDAARAALAEASGGALATTRTALLYLLPAEAAS